MNNADNIASPITHSGRIREKWGVVSDPGFLSLPYVLLLHQAELKLSSEHLNVLLNLLAHWHADGRMPYPHSATIAKRMGASPRTVQRALASLRKQGFIEKAPKRHRTDRQAYDMSPLVQKLMPYAVARVKFIIAKDFEQALSDADLDNLNRKSSKEMLADVLTSHDFEEALHKQITEVSFDDDPLV